MFVKIAINYLILNLIEINIIRYNPAKKKIESA